MNGKTPANMEEKIWSKQKQPIQTKTRGRLSLARGTPLEQHLELQLESPNMASPAPSSASFSSTSSSTSVSASASASSLWESPPSSVRWPAWSPSLRATVPFAWEATPGVPKVKANHKPLPLLPPLLPSPSLFGRLIPPPPVPSEPLRRRRRRGSKKSGEESDPFLTALLECTKPQPSPLRQRQHQRQQPPRQKPSSLAYSCMKSCSVVDSHVAFSLRSARIPTKHALVSSQSLAL